MNAAPTLVLLPGTDGGGDLFAPFIAALPPALPVIVVRYPTTGAQDYAALAAHARAALPSGRPFVLVGESFSGPVAVMLAAAAPPGLAGVVLCASFVRNPRPALAALRPLSRLLPVKAAPIALTSRLLLGAHDDDAQRAALRRALAKVDAATLRARLVAVAGCDVTAALAQIAVPLLYLRAAHDRIVPRTASEYIATRKPQTHIVELDAPHFLLQAVPKAAADAVTAFCGSLSPLLRRL